MAEMAAMGNLTWLKNYLGLSMAEFKMEWDRLTVEQKTDLRREAGLSLADETAAKNT